MYDFSYHRAVSAADAVAHVQDGKFLAGGQTLIATMKHRLAQPSRLVDLSQAQDLRGVEDLGETIRIRAMTTHSQVAQSEIVARFVPGLDRLANGIGDPAVRHRGAIGGSLANNDPAADYPAAVLALGAVIVTDRRAIAAQEFFDGLFSTSLAEDELIVAVDFPKTKLFYAKHPHPASRFAMAGVAVARHNGVRVAVTGCGVDGVFRWRAAEEALEQNFSADALADMAPDVAQISGDAHGSPEYRAHLVGHLARKAVKSAV